MICQVLMTLMLSLLVLMSLRLTQRVQMTVFANQQIGMQPSTLLTGIN